MGELKRTFVKGGMNLDLDERLVGQGLYREAINIRVSSSSEGNEGSLETVRANRILKPEDLHQKQEGYFGPRLQDFGRTVGTAIERTNDKAYHFVQNSVHVNRNMPDEDGGFENREVVVVADAIYEYNPPASKFAGDGLMDLVFNDVWEIRTVVNGIGEDADGSYIQLPVGGLQDLDIREDMRVFQNDNIIGLPGAVANGYVAASPINGNSQNPDSLLDIGAFFVKFVDRVNDRVYIKDDQGLFANSLAGPIQYATFRAKRILNFDETRYITGINVFDNLIFFTDGKYEPKKINIERSKIGTLSSGGSVYPSWINDRRFFHTRLVKSSSNNLAGFQNVPFWDFNGNIDNGTGGTIESHCTVIRPNPEEHLKVLTDIGAISSTDQVATGPSVGVMTHPFPIHPAHQAGKQLQFAVAYINENGFYNFGGGLLGVDSLGEPPYTIPGNVNDYYNLRFLYNDVLFGPAAKQENAAGFALNIESQLSRAMWDITHRGSSYTDDLYVTIGAMGGYDTNALAYGGSFGLNVSSFVFLDPESGVAPNNVVGEQPFDMYPLFRDYLNLATPNTGEQVWAGTDFGSLAPGQAASAYINAPGPWFSVPGNTTEEGGFPLDFAVQGGSDGDISPPGFDLSYFDLGWGRYSGPGSYWSPSDGEAPANANRLEYIDPTNPVGASMSFQDAWNSTVWGEEADGADGFSTHPVAKAYHRGGMYSKTNVIGEDSNIATVSSYWGLGSDPEGPMFEYIHNGRISINDNGDFRPSTPGRFVVQPHGFKVGDIVILQGHGNTIATGSYEGKYADKNIAGEPFITIPKNVEATFNNNNSNPGNQNELIDQDGDYYYANGGQYFNLDDGNGNSSGFSPRRTDDGFMDKVKARITKIEHVNMREESHVINVDGEQTEIAGGWIDCNGDEYTDLRDKFIFLDDRMVGEPIVDGTPTVPHTVDYLGSEVEISTPSFFSTPSYASQYIITIEIIENNYKKVTDPTLRFDLSNRHLHGDTGERIGHGDPTENATMLPDNYKAKKSPYFDLDMNWGYKSGPGGGIGTYTQFGFGQLPKYYGPPLPQVWSVSVASAVESDGINLTDEKALREQMLRFSYRYQYEDNEYSGLAPFTTVIWRTLNQKIDWPNYYISLLNEIKDLKLIDWRPKNLPKDVKGIELFVKSEEAVNIYAVKKYDFRDPEYLAPANGSYRGFHDFNANTLGLTLDPNQILRPFDSVPRAAKAQEVTANRVVYGNYLKDYNLVETAAAMIDGVEQTVDADIKVFLQVGLHNYISQVQGQITGSDGNPINVTIGNDEGAVEQFEDVYQGVNPNFGIPMESVKSYRSYQVGIVYRDEFGRETPVLTNKEAVIKVDPNEAKKTNRITVSVATPHPTWAKSYKFFIKDTSLDYHVLPLEQIRHFVQDDTEDSTDIESQNEALNEGASSLLIFSSDHRNKIQEGDIIIQKRAHRISGPPDPPLTNATNSFEAENLSLEYEVQRIRNEAPQALLDTLGEGDDNPFEGKFFVYVKTDRPLIFNNNVGALPGPNTAKTQGVFETRPKPNYDVDLYYEASQAYPVVLDDVTDEQFIKVGRMALPFVYTPLLGVTAGSLQPNSIANPLDTFFPAMFSDDIDGDGAVSYFDVDNFAPITVVSVNTSVGRHSINDDLYTEVKLSQPVTLTIPAAPGELVLRIQEHRGERLNVGEYVYVTLAQSVVNSDTILVKRHTHTSNFGGLVNNIVTPIALPWYNCFCFGNGIEISTARNSFNGARIQKGVKASSIYEDYAEVKTGTGLIFSGIYNSYSSFNETNQFIEALGITKRFNPDHGDVQKLFARSNDLIVLCEDKVLQVLSQKDAIFKADGNAELTSTSKVLGQSRAFDGEYGISRNPESFAHYGFRSYFTDAKRGVVLRLSKDGLTVISEQGMDSYFKNYLAQIRQSAADGYINSSYIFGSYDIDKGEYLVSGERFQVMDVEPEIAEGITICWDEGLNAWTSFRTYLATAQGYSLKNEYYTPFTNRLTRHDDPNAQYGFYDDYHSTSPAGTQDPRVAVVYNEIPGTVKDFTYANYEGTQARIIRDTSDGFLSTNSNRDGWWISSITTDLETGMSINFKNKENKWHNNLMPIVELGQGGYGAAPLEAVDYEKFIVVGEPSRIIDGASDLENSIRITFDTNNDTSVFDPATGETIQPWELDVNQRNTDHVDLSQINPGWQVYILKLENGFEDASQNPDAQVVSTSDWQLVGSVADLDSNLDSDIGYSSTHIDVLPGTVGQYLALIASPPFNNTYVPGGIDNADPTRYLIALSPTASERAGSVKGYFARTVWRNNDFENKSELFATALNAIESSK